MGEDTPIFIGFIFLPAVFVKFESFLNFLSSMNDPDPNPNPPLDDKSRYLRLQEQQHLDWEKTCTRCGACCGIIEGDPCEHLAAEPGGEYSCRIYENRFGLHKTVGGKPFRCVPIRDILSQSWLGDQCCGYKKNLRFKMR